MVAAVAEHAEGCPHCYFEGEEVSDGSSWWWRERESIHRVPVLDIPRTRTCISRDRCRGGSWSMRRGFRAGRPMIVVKGFELARWKKSKMEMEEGESRSITAKKSSKCRSTAIS